MLQSLCWRWHRCREDGRGIDINTLIDILKRDRSAFERDQEDQAFLCCARSQGLQEGLRGAENSREM